MEETKAVGMSYCELGLWEGGWVGGWDVPVRRGIVGIESEAAQANELIEGGWVSGWLDAYRLEEVSSA